MEETMMIQKMNRWPLGSIWALVMLLMGLSVASCGEDETIEQLAAKEGLNVPPPIGAAVFINPAYVDYTPGDSGTEAWNLETFYLSEGYPVTTFTGITAADFSGAVPNKPVLVIPELEMGDLNAALSPDARTAINTFVGQGGTLMIFYPDTWQVNLLNGVFGFSVVCCGGITPPVNLTGAASGTVFQSGPSSLPSNSATTSVVTGSLPIGSKVIYADASGNSVVSVVPYGAGRIVIFGWDWFDAQPAGPMDGGWLEVLRRATPGL